MSAAHALVRLVALAVPAGSRDRYREEWLADVDGARELGLPAAGVVTGAALLVATLDRADPAVSGMSTAQLAWRRGRWGAAFISTGLVLLFGIFVFGLGDVYDADTDSLSSELTAIGRPLLAAAVISLLVGLVWLAECLRALLRERASRRRVAATAVAVVLGPVLLLASTALLPIVGVLALFVVGAGMLALLITTAGGSPLGVAPAPRVRRLALAVPFGLAVVGLVTAGALHITVWNPLAKLPGLTLDEIYAGLAAAGELPSPLFLVIWIVVWTAAGVALVAVAASGRPAVARFLTLRRIAALGLALMSATVFFEWFAGFGMGMGVADAFGTTGGDVGPSGLVISAIGFAATLAAIFTILTPERRRPAAGQPIADSDAGAAGSTAGVP